MELRGPSAIEVDAIATDVSLRARQRLDALVRLLGDQQALVDETDEPVGDLFSRLAAWASRPAPVRDGVRLERRLEGAQRRVLGMRHRLDRVCAEVALLQDETAAIERCLAQVRRDQRSTQRQAIEAHLGEVLRVQQEFLALHQRLAGALASLADAGEAELCSLDRDLGRLAAEASARDLAHALGPWAGDTTVRRVNLAAREGRAVLLEAIDRLSEEVALLAPGHRGWAAAEAEVSVALRPLDAIVARWREERDGR